MQALCGSNKELLMKITAPMIEHVVQVIQHLKNKLDVVTLSDAEVYERLQEKAVGAILEKGVDLIEEPKRSFIDEFVLICGTDEV